MKRRGIGIALVLTWILLSVGGARAQTAITTNPNFSDPVICPNGCIQEIVTAVTNYGILVGSVYVDPATKGAIPVPGGYDLVVLSAYSAAVSTDDVAVGGGEEVPTGTLGTKYADGRYAGFYQAPNGKYYPIDASKKATRNWPGKGQERPVLNCPDDSEPDFGAEAELQTICGGKSSPVGNRVKYSGVCGCYEWRNEQYCGTWVTITSTCKLKCPDHGTKFKGIYRWVCPKGDQDNCFSKLIGYTCEPVGVSGTVYFDEGNTCSTARGWDQGGGLRVSVRGTGYSGNVVSGTVDAGRYFINTPDANATYPFLDLTGIPAGYECSSSCGGCPTKESVGSRSIGNNFFLTRTNTRVGWWQASGAGIYAGKRLQIKRAVQSGFGQPPIFNVNLGQGRLSRRGAEKITKNSSTSALSVVNFPCSRLVPNL